MFSTFGLKPYSTESYDPYSAEKYNPFQEDEIDASSRAFVNTFFQGKKSTLYDSSGWESPVNFDPYDQFNQNEGYQNAFNPDPYYEEEPALLHQPFALKNVKGDHEFEYKVVFLQCYHPDHREFLNKTVKNIFMEFYLSIPKDDSNKWVIANAPLSPDWNNDYLPIVLVTYSGEFPLLKKLDERVGNEAYRLKGSNGNNLLHYLVDGCAESARGFNDIRSCAEFLLNKNPRLFFEKNNDNLPPLDYIQKRLHQQIDNGRFKNDKLHASHEWKLKKFFEEYFKTANAKIAIHSSKQYMLGPFNVTHKIIAPNGTYVDVVPKSRATVISKILSNPNRPSHNRESLNIAPCQLPRSAPIEIKKADPNPKHIVANTKREEILTQPRFAKTNLEIKNASPKASVSKESIKKASPQPLNRKEPNPLSKSSESRLEDFPPLKAATIRLATNPLSKSTDQIPKTKKYRPLDDFPDWSI